MNYVGLAKDVAVTLVLVPAFIVVAVVGALLFAASELQMAYLSNKG